MRFTYRYFVCNLLVIIEYFRLVESVMAEAEDKPKEKRYSFPPDAFNILQDIIMNGSSDNGRFMTVIVDRSSGKNLKKLAVWTEVTALFNQVSVILDNT